MLRRKRSFPNVILGDEVEYLTQPISTVDSPRDCLIQHTLVPCVSMGHGVCVHETNAHMACFFALARS